MSVQGFWGLQVLPGKTYSQIVSSSFRITMAALPESATNKKRTSVCVKVDNEDYVLCTLVPGKIDQQILDISFVEEEEVTFMVKGDNTVHLTGNYTSNQEDWSDGELSTDEDEEEEEEDDEDEELLSNPPKGLDRAKINAYLRGELDSDAFDDEEEEEEDVEEEEEEEEEEQIPDAKKNKRPAEVKSEQAATKKQKTAVPEKEVKADKETPKKDEAKKEAPKKQEKKQVTKLQNGLIIEEVKVGDGPSAKNGSRIGVRYVGKLAKNGKIFDKNISGKPFTFVLGRNEVIKGWDLGIAGMKLGSERKLTIPAALAYGKRGSPPVIAPGTDLVFEIKLVTMK
ncbi:peptidylprolyl isomerase fpr4 [Apophysomyces sp. BC1034]|nr:peptidylprolyl isomerase fpr4 [Apophysomyces sp. BC1015]KAG0173058.1 peptidylprolyl isomerase fpr4 [Apophysomyces sp. BC1021]KAG0185376.1 peptidylprolyl isomerase fpr4 [Apophysomyces sp. BC1034]